MLAVIRKLTTRTVPVCDGGGLMEKGKLIGQGRTAEIFALSNSRVLKLFRSDMAHKSVEKEFKIGKLLADTGVPAPIVHKLVTVEGRQGIISELIPGKTMLANLVAKPYAAGVQARKLASIHHQMHSCQADQLPNQKQTLATFINQVRVLSPIERHKILDYLDSLPEGNQLCHGDFHPDNVMVSFRVAVVVDWMNATSGDPAADVARTSLLLRDAALPPGTAGIKAKLLDILRSRFYSAYLREYLKISSLTVQQVEAWTLPVAAARLAEDLSQAEKEILLRIVHLKCSQL